MTGTITSSLIKRPSPISSGRQPTRTVESFDDISYHQVGKEKVVVETSRGGCVVRVLRN